MCLHTSKVTPKFIWSNSHPSPCSTGLVVDQSDIAANTVVKCDNATVNFDLPIHLLTSKHHLTKNLLSYHKLDSLSNLERTTSLLLLTQSIHLGLIYTSQAPWSFSQVSLVPQLCTMRSNVYLCLQLLWFTVCDIPKSTPTITATIYCSVSNCISSLLSCLVSYLLIHLFFRYKTELYLFPALPLCSRLNLSCKY